MKIARYASIGMAGLLVVATRAGAQSTTPVPDDNPYTQYDPDGVPLAVTHPLRQRLSQAQVDAIHKQQEQEVLDKNWLLRNYEQQVKARADKSPEDQSSNLYYQLSSNKEMAKLAGLPDLDSDDQDSAPPAPHPDEDSVKLRVDASPATTEAFQSHANLFKPLITPLSSPEAASLHNFYSTLPLAMVPPISGGLPQPPPAPRTDRSQDSLDLETPGMVAAEKDPLMDTSAPDLTLDVLPGESIEEARARQEEGSAKLELPLPMDANQLHKEQAATLSVTSVPRAPNAAQTAATVPIPQKAAPVENPDDAPLPVNSIPPINPVRSPIANPYDILNR